MANKQLYNLSKYAKAYYKDNGDLRGLMLSGFADTDNGKQYVNLWLPAEDVKITQSRGGEPVIAIKIKELEKKEAGYKTDKGGEAKKTAAAPEPDTLF